MGDVRTMEHVGGHAAVDFVNTLGGLPEDPDDEYLHGYADVVAFVADAGLVGTASAERLVRAAARRAAPARAALDDVLRLRDVLDRVLRAHLDGRPPRPRDADALRDAYRDALSTAALQPVDDRFRWTWPANPTPLELPLHLLAGQAVDLLRDGGLDRLSRCGHCRWLFLDTSRSRNRRWCSMSACGSVVKMRRYRAGRRAVRPS
jgi:predicted RNA-binding Zn ribbon-like protein